MIKKLQKFLFVFFIISLLPGKNTLLAQTVTFDWNGTVTSISGGEGSGNNYNNYYNGTVQTWTVPTCVTTLTITALGGAGGSGSGGDGDFGVLNGGLGASITGTVTVTPGDVIDIIVGGQGGCSYYDGGGGGGGSFIWDNTSNTLLVVAGGGGGAGGNAIVDETGANGQTDNTSAATLEAATNDPDATCGAGGTGGNGGASGGGGSTNGAGCGGAGWLSNGAAVTGTGTYAYNGYGIYPENATTPAYGGIADPIYNTPYSGAGGFGGGAGCGWGGGGGGGGYNGGGGAYSTGLGAGEGNGGGGGGSYCFGTKALSTTTGSLLTNGKVTITWIAQEVVLTMAVPIEPLCNGETGSATVSASGSMAPYTYAWAPIGGTGATGTGLTAGTYTVTVTSNSGCTQTASVVITQPTLLTATMGVPTEITCNGGNGSATASATGGTTPYTYSWTPAGGTGAEGTGLNAGTYTVTIKDKNGCTSTATVTITQPTLLTPTMGVPTEVSCNGGVGNATVTVTGGTIPYTYAWTPTGGTGAEGTGLTAGTYTITVHDNHDCEATATVTVTQPPLLTATISASTNVLCNGGNTGSATVFATGGTMPYTYSWAPNGGNTATGVNLTAGTYTVTIKDANDCSSSATVTITQPKLLTASIGAPVNVLCNGGNNGSATASATGGTSPYTYTWSPSGETTATGTELTAGTYTINIVDANGCTSTSTVTITQPDLLAATTSSTQASCSQSNGSATVTTTGGTTPYTYLWTPSSQTTQTAVGISAGIYNVLVTDNNNCTTTATVTVTEPTTVAASISATTAVTCFGANNGTATATATGGTAPYSFVWSPGGNTDATGVSLSSGSYTMTVTDQNGCTSTALATITQPPLLTASIAAPTNVLCNGGNNGSATASATGGTTPYNFVWSPGGNTNSTGVGLPSGSYTMTVTDQNGCPSTASVTITQPLLLTATIGAPTNVLCNGGNNGSATASATGGTSPYTYTWSPSGETTATGTELTAGTYTINIVDANGCTSTSTVTITQPDLLAATTSSTQASCSQSNGSATVTTTGGTTPYTYLWTPSSQTTQTAVGISAGIYNVLVTDNNNCTTTATVTVTEPTTVAASISATTAVTCFGANNGTATATATGGTAPYSFVWSPGGNTDATGVSLSSGSYTMTVTDQNGCTSTALATITQPPLLTASIAAPTNVLCNGGNNGSATASATGGTTPYNFVWSPGGNTNSTGVGLPSGSYTMTVTDQNGCPSTASVTITQPLLLTATIGAPTNVLCNGGNNGSATASATGGTSPYTYTWSPSGETTATGTELAAGTYTINIVDANGCTSTSTVTITQPDLLAATTSSTQASCSQNNGSATVTTTGGTTPYTYLWTPSSQTTQTAAGISAGIYNVLVTDNNNCTTTATVTVTEPSAVSVAINTSTNISCNGANNGTATATANGGTPPYTYSWAPSGGSGAEAIGLPIGTYTVNTKDANGCSSTASVTITQPNVLGVSLDGPTQVCIGTSGTLTATVTGGTLPYTYSWAPYITTATSTATVTPPVNTTYTVTVTDANGCTATTTWIVTLGPPMTLSVSGATSICGGKSATLCAAAGAGSGGYNYTWQPGNATTQCITVYPTVTTTYTAYVHDNCGTIITDTATIQISPLPDVTFTADIYQGCAPFCIKFQNTSTISGGGSAESYIWSFGNGDTLQIENPLYCYANSGGYNVSLTVTSVSGCSATLKKSNLITVFSPPKAAFTSSPSPATILDATIKFTDQSNGSAPIIQWYWSNFGDATDSTSILQNPTHTYQDTGTFCTNLTVTDMNGCTDSTSNCMVVTPVFSLFIPSAFTPNGDGINDVFQPKGKYIKTFEMYIFDRWGQQVYYTTNINDGWTGSGKGGTMAQEDTYVYKILITDTENNLHSYVGAISLLK